MTPYVSVSVGFVGLGISADVLGGFQWFNGDGVVSAFRVKDGFVDLKQKYVRTEKYVREAEARRALLGESYLDRSHPRGAIAD